MKRVVVFFFAFIASEIHALPKESRAAILDYGRTAVGAPYKWGGSSWHNYVDANGITRVDSKKEGPDCVGFALKALGYPQRLPIEKSMGNKKPLSNDLKNGSFPWTLHKFNSTADYRNAKPADVLYYKSFYSVKEGRWVYHPALIESVGSSFYRTLEARTKHKPVGYFRRSFFSLRTKSYVRRIVRNNLKAYAGIKSFPWVKGLRIKGEAAKFYKVRRFDKHLQLIADTYQTTASHIRALNGIKDPKWMPKKGTLIRVQ